MILSAWLKRNSISMESINFDLYNEVKISLVINSVYNLWGISLYKSMVSYSITVFSNMGINGFIESKFNIIIVDES